MIVFYFERSWTGSSVGPVEFEASVCVPLSVDFPV
jgi:hypothetical protein